MDSFLGDTIVRLQSWDEITSLAASSSQNDNRLFREDNGLCIHLCFSLQPKDISKGFVFGSGEHCDVILRQKNVLSRHFAITFNPASGLLLLENRASSGTMVGDKMILERGQTRLLQDKMRIKCSGLTFISTVPDRGQFHTEYHKKLGKYLGYLLAAGPCVSMSYHSTPILKYKQVGSYLVVEELGNGGFGQVCLLAEINTGNVYAAKRFKNQKDIAGIKHEIATLKKLSHPSIVRFNECITEPDGSVYLIMEHVPFGDLEKRGTLKTPVALEVLVQCLEGLAYLHDAGIAHRDIKPSNIVMQSDFPVCVKIVDFGLAMESQLFKTPCTTFIFQAPEILDGNSYNHVVDIWALGIVMLYLLGRFPDDESRRFYGTKQKREFDQYVDAMYQACESLQSPLNEFIRGMLVVEPKDRWSARKCLQEIKKVQRAFSQHGQARQVLAPPPVDHDAPARGHLTVPDRYAAMDWSPASVERRPSTVGGDEMDWSPEKIKDYNLEKNLRNSR